MLLRTGFAYQAPSHQKSVSLPVVTKPIPSTYGIRTYIWLILLVNVGKYLIHGWNGKGQYYPQKNNGNFNVIISHHQGKLGGQQVH